MRIVPFRGVSPTVGACSVRRDCQNPENAGSRGASEYLDVPGGARCLRGLPQVDAHGDDDRNVQRQFGASGSQAKNAKALP
jgi:hypothetical protein